MLPTFAFSTPDDNICFLLLALNERLATGDVLLVANFDAWVFSDLYLILFHFVENAFGEDVENLLDVDAGFGGSFQKRDVSFLGEAEAFFEGYLASEIV